MKACWRTGPSIVRRGRSWGIYAFWLATALSLLHARPLTFTGYMTAAGGEVIADTLITLAAADGTILRTVVSDDEGRFVLSWELADDNLTAAAGFTLTAERVGYETRTLFYTDGEAGATTFTTQPIVMTLVRLKTLGEEFVRSGSRLSDRERISISTTTLTEEDIESIKIRDVSDLTGVSANLYSLDSGSAFGSFFSLRGISSLNTFDPLVVMYIDDVAQFQSHTAPLNFANLESIRILKGPQLTLYGRNAMAGVIDIKTKQPTRPFAVSVTTEGELSILDNNLAPKGNVGLFFSTPFVYPQSFFRVHAQLIGGDGIISNLNFDKNTGGVLSWNTSWELILPLTSMVSLTAIGKYYSDESELYPYAETVEEAYANPYQVKHNVDNFSKRATGEMTLKFNVEHSYFKLLSTTTYQNYSNDIVLDADFSERSTADLDINFKHDLFTQELRFTSTSVTERYVSWLAGMYFYAKAQQYQTSLWLFRDSLDDEPDSIAGDELATGTALFSSVTVPFWQERMAVVMGYRLDIETRRFTNVNFIGIEVPELSSDDAIFLLANYHSGKMALSTKISQPLNHFFSIATGFRPGGVNLLVTSSDGILYDSEYSTHVETGLQGDFKPIHFNVSFFYIYWQNQQLALAYPEAEGVFEFGIINIEEPTHNYGVEYEMDWRLLYGFGIDTVIGYTEADYRVYTPRVTAVVALKHAYATKSKFFRYLIRVEYRYLTEVFFEITQEAGLTQPGYGLFNFSSNLYFGKSFFINFWAKNILDERYLAFILPFGTLPTEDEGALEAAKLGDPITVGLKLAYTF